MALFKSNDPTKLINAAEANLTRLKTELAESQAMVKRHRATATRLAVEGTDTDGRERAQKSMRAAQDAADTGSEAIGLVEKQLAGHLADRDKAADTATRHASANEVEALLAESGAIVREGEVYFKHLAEWCAKVAPNVPEAHGVEQLAIAMRSQIPEAMTLFQKLLGYLGASILAGTTAPTLKTKDVPLVEPIKSDSSSFQVTVGPARKAMTS